MTLKRTMHLKAYKIQENAMIEILISDIKIYFINARYKHTYTTNLDNLVVGHDTLCFGNR